MCREAYDDFTALDPEHKYHDPKSTPEKPIWQMVDVEFVEKFAEVVSMDEMRATKGLEDLEVIRKGQRLSIMPVTKAEFDIVRKAGRKK